MTYPRPPAHPARSLVVAHAAGAGALAVFTAAVVLLAAVAGDAIQQADDALLHSFAQRRLEGGLEIALDITALGNTMTLAVLVACVAVALWNARRAFDAVTLVSLFVTGRLLTEVLKAVFQRPRPEAFEWGVHVTSASLPSAHAMSATIVYGAVGWLLIRPPLPYRARTILWVLVGAVVAAVSASRVYLGVHYPSDVVAGFVAGAVWLAAAFACLRAP
jgi:membrane-associated phospholipid phosphatase